MVKIDTAQKNFRLTDRCITLLDRVTHARGVKTASHALEHLVREEAARLYLDGKLTGALEL